MRQPENLYEYDEFAHYLKTLDPKTHYDTVREFARRDLFYLLRYICQRKDMNHPWLIARCKEVQSAPDGYLDLWAREHYKSSLITFGKTIQDILASYGNDPLPEWKGIQPTFAIFSHTRPIAKGFLRQIKREFENNQLLKAFFPDIVWEEPSNSGQIWSEDGGLVLKRKSNPKEATIEAWGLVESQPIGKHFDVMIYDDIVTMNSVNTPDMMTKTIEAWEMSINLGAGEVRRRHIGTRYHFNDAYREIMARGAAKPRIYPATKDGTPDGEPVLKSQEKITELRKFLGPYAFASQQLLNPLADETQSLKKEWINYIGRPSGENLNKYLIIDPASEKKRSSDYTSMFVIGLGGDDNYYVLDMIRDRLNLTERADAVFSLHRRWKPLAVGYEKYGLQADIEHIKERQRRENYHFRIIELGGQMAKNDRIKRLIPSLSAGRWYYPDSLFKTTYDKKTYDLIDVYRNEEYLAFPVCVHDDMLDCQSRIIDTELNAIFPRIEHDSKQDRYSRAEQRQSERSGSSWGV